MNESLWHLTATFCAIVGMAYLALSFDANWRRVFNDAVKPNIPRLRIAGWFFLALSAIACFKADHASMAVLVWVMLLAPAAVTVALTLTGYRRLLRVVCLGMLRVKTEHEKL